MKLKIFAVKDTRAEAFMNPFFCRTAGEAERAFSDEANKKENPFNLHPTDYCLFELGSYDQISGVITPDQAPRVIGTADSFIQKPQLRSAN